MTRTLVLSASLIAAVALASGPPTPQYRARVRPASKEAAAYLKRIRVPKGIKASLWAAEPLLANPVVFALDNKNRVYVAETYRLHQGVSDIRGYENPPKYWLDDDLACRTVADRIAMTRKHLGKKADDWAKHHERIRLVEDATGKGVATRSTVYADGFSRLEEGIAAGLLSRGDTVWYTCIPDLVKLRDPKRLGVATEREVLSTGYGVHMGFLGHDLHGLKLGMDGRLYFSVGDRGLNVRTKEGRHLMYPDTGCVLRCELDGSGLEVFATGLRNPQELAFDKYGNLFTGDNNSDSGDRARWVYLMQGGDCGWRIGYQFKVLAQGPRGPWNAEKMWHPPHAGQPAWIVPPIANVSDGPSGLAYYPGIGLPARYDDHFFLADFRGGAANSGIRSFMSRPRGAGFTLEDSHQFIWGVLATDVDFRTDGSLLVSDWVSGWGLTGKGRLWKFASDESNSSVAKETSRLLGEGFSGQSVDALARLLGHADQRVRLEAHLELASRGAKGAAALSTVATSGKATLARIHAIWGLGIQGRKDRQTLEPVRKLLEDADAEVRAQACKVLGEAGIPVPAAMLRDESPRVQSLAALALGQAGGAADTKAVASLLAKNADADPWLRHAAVMALTRCAEARQLDDLAAHANPSVRRGALLAMRRTGSAAISRFLNDAEPGIVAEAARAINDVPIASAMPALAGILSRRGLPAPATYRALNAAFRLGTKAQAQAVARFAARSDVTPALRKEALGLLETWAKPNGRDRIIGVWRPLPSRSREIAPEALRDQLAGIFTAPDDVRRKAASVAAKLGVKEVGAALFGLLADAKTTADTRAESLRALASLKDRRIDEAVKLALGSDAPIVRAAGREVLSRRKPAEALKELASALTSGQTVEKQAALAVLGGMKGAGPARLLGDQLTRGAVPTEVRLDLIEAAEKHRSLKGQLAAFEKKQVGGEQFGKWRFSMVGGDAARGKEVFLNKAAVSCLRCHKAEGHGAGEVGPDLTGIGLKQKRDYLLESILSPSKQIAKGYESVDLRLVSGVVRSGILKSETASTVTIMSPEGALSTIRKDRIESRTKGKSAMPEDLTKHLSRQEVRDLVEFLASLKKEPKK